MSPTASAEDLEFRRAFQACETAHDDFDHAAHVRLAYIYLCDSSVEAAAHRMKKSLLAFLAHLGRDANRYHETITQAWIRAVKHFMEQTADCSSAAEFLAANPILLDSKILLTHYSPELLFSSEARQSFVPPDLQSIPP
jgi:hypothetical protein